jgi:hypothetical protein
VIVLSTEVTFCRRQYRVEREGEKKLAIAVLTALLYSPNTLPLLGDHMQCVKQAAQTASNNSTEDDHAVARHSQAELHYSTLVERLHYSAGKISGLTTNCCRTW